MIILCFLPLRSSNNTTIILSKIQHTHQMFRGEKCANEILAGQMESRSLAHYSFQKNLQMLLPSIQDLSQCSSIDFMLHY